MRYVTMKLCFRAVEDAFFPLNPVNTFRGAMGYSLRHIACIQRKSNDKYACNSCKAVGRCAYALCYETNRQHLGTGISYNLRTFEAPHLMNIDSGFPGNTTVKAGDVFSFSIRLFGTAASIAPHLIVAAQNAAEHGFKGARAELESIVDESTGKTIWSLKNDSLMLPEVVTLRVNEPDLSLTEPCELMLNFVTPVAFRDVKSGGVTKEPEFERIIGSLMRRYTIFEATEDRQLDWNFTKISELARQVRISGMDIEPVYWERYSTRQQQRMPISGIIGKVRYSGPVLPFEELLNAGEILRCGKNITFGQGRINVAQIRHLSNRDDFQGFLKE